MQMIQSGMGSMGSMFQGLGSSGAAANVGAGSSGFGAVDPSMAPSVSSALASNPALSQINPSQVAGMSGAPGATSTSPTDVLTQLMNDPTTDPMTKAIVAQIIQSKPNTALSGISALEPLGQTLLAAKLRPKEFGPLAHPASPSAQQPGPGPNLAQQPPASPIDTARLIAQLL